MSAASQGLTEAEELELLELEEEEAKKHPGVPGQYFKLPDGTEVSAQTDEESQLAYREMERLNQTAADQHFPKSGFVANMAGEIGRDVAVAGPAMISPAYQALTGGVRGYFGNDSDDKMNKAASTVLGAGVGYGVSQVGPLLALLGKTPLAQSVANSAGGKSAREILGKVARWPGEALERAGVSMGRNVLSGAKGLKAEEALPDDAIREAMDAGAVKFFGTTKGASKRLEALRDRLGGEYADLVAEMKAKGIQGPEVEKLSDMWLKKALDKESRSLGSQVPGLYLDRAEEIGSKAGPDGRLALDQGLDITRDLQSQARYGKFEETLLNKAKRDIASDVRGGIEGEVEKAAVANPALRELADKFKPYKGRLGRLIEADEHAFQEANRIASRSKFNLTDALVGSNAFTYTQDPAKAAAAYVASHVLRSRGPSTAAVALRGTGKGWLKVVQNAPEVFGEFGSVIAGQKTPEGRVAIAEELAARYPAFAEILESVDARPSDEQASLAPGTAPRKGDPLRAIRRGR